MKRLLFALFIGLLSLTLIQAQETTNEIDYESIDTEVYVTTQFNLNFREGPSMGWDIIEMLPPATTMPAIGRTASTGWVQVVHNGQLGWVATKYVVWSGDIISLPVDGRFFENYVRRVGVLTTTVRETPYYKDWVDPSTQVGVLPEETQVEVIGRLGYRNNLDFNVMILYQDQFYWVGAWDLSLEAGYYRSVLDNSYRNAYSRLVSEFDGDIAEGGRRLSSIENIWRTLQRGQGVSCGHIPSLLPERTVSNSDLNSYPQFGSVASALDTAIGHVNTAIAMFEDACNREDSFITQQDVREALDVVDRARQNYNVARSLLISLQRRDPLLGDIEG